MKRNVIMSCVLLVLGIFVLMPQTSFAAAGTWVTAEVKQVGVNADAGILSGQFTFDVSGVSTTKWLRFSSEFKNQMMATALTAITLDRTVLLHILTDGLNIDILMMSPAE